MVVAVPTQCVLSGGSSGNGVQTWSLCRVLSDNEKRVNTGVIRRVIRFPLGYRRSILLSSIPIDNPLRNVQFGVGQVCTVGESSPPSLPTIHTLTVPSVHTLAKSTRCVGVRGKVAQQQEVTRSNRGPNKEPKSFKKERLVSFEYDKMRMCEGGQVSLFGAGENRMSVY